MIEKKIPEGWILVPLSNMATVQSGGTPSRGNSSYWGGSIPWVKISDIENWLVKETDEYITELGLKNSSTRIFPKGTILLTIFATIGRVGVLEIDAATNQAIAGITPSSELSNKYITYALINLANELIGKAKGVAQKNINQAILKDSLIPLPPLAEQKRIVAKLDMAFGYLETLKASLARIPELLKTFRESVLTQAVTGKLTEDWREGKDLDDWNFTALGELGEVSGGLTLNSKRQDYSLVLPYLRVANVYSNLIVLNEVKYIGLEEKELDRVRLLSGDILIVEGNGSPDQIGRAAIWNNEIENCVHQNHLIKFRAPTRTTAEYCLLFLISKQGREQIQNASRSTSGLYTLSLTKVSELKINLPSLSEQQEIVTRVNSLFAKADAIEAQYLSLKEKIDKLSQALLAKAFRGELVPQDPADEPASVLLEKIQKEIRKFSKKGKKQMELVFED